MSIVWGLEFGTWCKVAESRFERAKVGAMLKELRKFASQLHLLPPFGYPRLDILGDMLEFDTVSGPVNPVCHLKHSAVQYEHSLPSMSSVCVHMHKYLYIIYL